MTAPQEYFCRCRKGGRKGDRGQPAKCSTFHDFFAGKMYTIVQEWVFPFIKDLHKIRPARIPSIWVMQSSKYPRRLKEESD